MKVISNPFAYHCWECFADRGEPCAEHVMEAEDPEDDDLWVTRGRDDPHPARCQAARLALAEAGDGDG